MTEYFESQNSNIPTNEDQKDFKFAKYDIGMKARLYEKNKSLVDRLYADNQPKDSNDIFNSLLSESTGETCIIKQNLNTNIPIEVIQTDDSKGFLAKKRDIEVLVDDNKEAKGQVKSKVIESKKKDEFKIIEAALLDDLYSETLSSEEIKEINLAIDKSLKEQ
jgi:hypothetical protein